MDLEIKELKEMRCCEECKQPITTRINILGKERIVPIACECRIKEREIQEQKKAREELENRMKTLISQGIMDKQYFKNTFENDNGSNPKILNTCRKYVDKWEKIKKENIGMLLYGDVGRGKTFYACCIANELLKKNVSICITSFPKIINKLMNFDEASKTIVEKIKSQSLLVIDDFGVERETEYSLEQMFNILDDRLKTGLPTIITTNLDIDILETPNTLEQRRIYSRILEMCPIRMLVKNQNNREINTNNKTNIARHILINNI